MPSMLLMTSAPIPLKLVPPHRPKARKGLLVQLVPLDPQGLRVQEVAPLAKPAQLAPLVQRARPVQLARKAPLEKLAQLVQ